MVALACLACKAATDKCSSNMRQRWAALGSPRYPSNVLQGICKPSIAPFPCALSSPRTHGGDDVTVQAALRACQLGALQARPRYPPWRHC
jgi:hypothetical protein